MLSIPYFQAEFRWSQSKVNLFQLKKTYLEIAVLKKKIIKLLHVMFWT